MCPTKVDPPVPAEQPTEAAREDQTNAAMQSSSSPGFHRLGLLWRLAARSYHSCPEASSARTEAIAVEGREDPRTLRDSEELDVKR